MQQGYFAAAWNDVKNTPGWVGKMILLALINLIPIFGQIVTAGYLYGWARDAAWGLQTPMPKRIFGNEDGRLYSRGFFIFVLELVFGLALGALAAIAIVPMIGVIGLSATGDVSSFAAVGGILLFILIFTLAFLALSILVSFFLWGGSMRISIYGRLSAGFQLKKIGKMLRKDVSGIFKIFGISLLLGLIVGFIFSIASSAISLIMGFSMAGLMEPFYSSAHRHSYSYGAGASIGVLAILLLCILSFLEYVVLMWVNAIVARALGYWTRQFDIPNWRGQDDPMPFELSQTPQASGQAHTYSYRQYPATQQPGAPTAYQPGTQPQPQAQPGTQPQPQAQPGTQAQAPTSPQQAAGYPVPQAPTPSAQPAPPPTQPANNQADVPQQTPPSSKNPEDGK